MSSSYYDIPTWNTNPSRQSSWDQPPPSRSGTTSRISLRTEDSFSIGASSTVSREESTAFQPQFEGSFPFFLFLKGL
jgi:hypothetical protein